MALIQAILFDIGGTLRYTHRIHGRNPKIIRELMDILQLDIPLKEFVDLLVERETQYRKWIETNLIELSEADLWTKFMMPDSPPEFVAANAIRLNQLWRASRGTTVLREDTVQTIRELKKRGYRLGIISNTTSSVEAPQLIRDNGLEDCFSTVILSTVFGRKKPHPSIFYAAAKEIRIPVQNCAYVGNSVRRDVIGSREAGIGEVVLIDAEGSETGERSSPYTPDHWIKNLSDLLAIYPGVQSAATPAPDVDSPVLYDAALSTMWHVRQPIPFRDTFAAARSLGFARFELNHQIPPDLFDQVDFNQFRIGSLHDPCPAIISMDEQKVRDWMISSLDEDCRRQGVAIIRRTIDEAVKLHARMVVIHPGSIVADTQMDRRLRKLFKEGDTTSAEYLEIKAALIDDRKKRAAPHLDAVIRSLREIIEFTRPTGLSLGLENRYRYYDIPILDEMEQLLEQSSEEWYGFQYDVGHAQTLDRLGLCNHESWLQRYGARMIGVHLHDVDGIADHQKPGSGQVDFRMVARYLSDRVYRTIEVSPELTMEDISAGMQTLAQFGCVNRL